MKKFFITLSVLCLVLAFVIPAQAQISGRFSGVKLEENPDRIVFPDIESPSGTPEANTGWLYQTAYGTTGSGLFYKNEAGSIVAVSPIAKDLTAATTLTVADCGGTFFLNAATEFQTTLPAVSTIYAGCRFEFICKAAPASASYTILTGNTDEDVLIGGINELETDDTEDGPYDASADTITFADGVAVVGDAVTLVSDGTSFYVRGQANADGGVTITDSD